jgi:hypothetical protein
MYGPYSKAGYNGIGTVFTRSNLYNHGIEKYLLNQNSYFVPEGLSTFDFDAIGC